MLLSKERPITDSLPFLESFSRQFCSLRLVQSRLDCALFCCKARYFFQFGFLFVVLYPVEAKSSFSFSCYRLCQTCRSMFKKKKPGDGRILYILADGVIALVLCLFSDKTRSFNQWKRSLHPNFIQNAN